MHPRRQPGLVQRAAARWLGSEVRPTRLRSGLKAVRNLPRIVGDHSYDARRYYLHSSTLHYLSRESLAARITSTSHAVERGLALPEPRPGFAVHSVAYLLDAIEEYIRRFGIDGALRSPAGALAEYVEFHQWSGVPQVPNGPRIDDLLARLEPIRSRDHQEGGTLRLTRDAITRHSEHVTADFFTSRHSVRQFADGAVSVEDIEAAIEIAQRSPAACNRQECRVYVLHDPTLIADVLTIQGSRGFNHQIRTLLLLTHRLTAFNGAHERNQCWIDGGMFAMSLVLGLHSRGLGTCCLNWSKSAPDDRALRKVFPIPSAEVVLMFVAVGQLPADLVVARSVRPDVASACRHVRRIADLAT